MLVEKEVIRPGTYWYRDEATGTPRKLVVTPELTRYWHEQGNAMLSAGLTVPVPCEHDFNAHPMTPADKLLNNAGWVKGYRLRGDTLWSAVDVLDDALAKKLPSTIRWTSPWINSFTDGSGKEWKNVISHLALTTRPRIIEQAPFSGIAAALSMATEVRPTRGPADLPVPRGGFCLSRAGRLFVDRATHSLRPRYPVAFSMWNGGIGLGGFPPPRKSELPEDELEADGGLTDDPDAADASSDPNATPPNPAANPLANPLADMNGDVGMEELLCDLLQALGVPMPDESNEQEFKRHLYEAAMSQIKELTSKSMAGSDPSKMVPDQNKPTTQQPNASHPSKVQNPLIQQEQQPMYMSHDEAGRSAARAEARGASRSASEASMATGHERLTQRSRTSEALSEEGEHGMAAEHHGRIADEHETVAKDYESGGGKEAADKHHAAATAHRKAATAHGSVNGGMSPATDHSAIPSQEIGRSTMMSLEEINKLPDPMRGVALSMYEENQRIRTEMEAHRKVTNSLRDAKLKEASVARLGRINLLGRLSPRVKADLDAMLAQPSMALSMGDGGVVVDPMAATLAVLEKGLGDLPRLLVTDASAMSVQSQPTDETMLTDGQIDTIADSLARQMGCSPLTKAS